MTGKPYKSVKNSIAEVDSETGYEGDSGLLSDGPLLTAMNRQTKDRGAHFSHTLQEVGNATAIVV